MLRFSGKQSYYALDGQHRLKAIKSLLQPEDESERIEPPPGFEDEEISVLMVLRYEDTEEDEWLRAYRRLFSYLNRYAKPTDPDTNIIMDEDDLFAILTRRLIAEHDFFRAPGRHAESLRVQTKGRPLKEGTSHFTSLQQLYDLNEALLTTPLRGNVGWGPEEGADRIREVKQFKRFRPPEDYIDDLFDELVLYWDALIGAIPALGRKPSQSRNHQAENSNGEDEDNVLFWPIGQAMMIRVARALLDRNLPDPGEPGLEDARAALSPLGAVEWRLHRVPWRGLLLVSVIDGRSKGRKWAMRNENRKGAVDVGTRVLRWITGCDQRNESEEEELREEWEDLLVLSPGESPEGWWEQVRP